MRVLRCLIVIVVVCGFTGLAGAAPIDFHMHVLDPPPPSFTVQPILTTPFTFSFTECSPGELPNNMTASGCFAGVNSTGQDWTSLQITFADNSVLAGQAPNCDLTGSNNIFSGTDCSLDGSTYVLSFMDGVLHNNDFFFITEDGVDPPEGFGTGTGTVTDAVMTPEPGSILLLSTGIVLFGLLFHMERRRTVPLAVVFLAVSEIFSGRRLPMRRILFCALLLLAVSGAAGAAQSISVGPKASRVDSAMQVTLGDAAVELSGPWKFHIGDDMAWAQPGFNDSGWDTMDMTPPPGTADATLGSSGYIPGWTARGYPGYSGYAWYRLKIDVQGTNDPLALKMPDNADDAYQVYVNGQRIGEFGRFTARGVTAYSTLPRRLSSAVRRSRRSGDDRDSHVDGQRDAI